MIIVEGPDGSGKTTLVNELCADLGFQKGKRSVVDRNDLYKVTRPDFYRAVAAEINGDSPVYVWDRLFFSELVYYPYTTGKCQFKPMEQRFATHLLTVMRAPVIVCLPPLPVVKDNVRRTEEVQTDYAVDKVEEVYEAYKELQAYPMGTVFYDYTSQFADKHRESISHHIGLFLELREERK